MRLLTFLLVAVAVCAQEPKELASLRYIDIEQGTGAPAAAGKRFTVHYTGRLKDGTKFDSSVDRSEPFSFVQGRKQVIIGWDVGFEGMKVGGKRKLIIPYQLAYGEAGSGPIPPKAELTFDVELLAVADAPLLAPAIDLIIPYKDLEARALLLKDPTRMAKIALLNDTYLKAAQSDKPVISAEGSDEIPDLKESFAAMRKELASARNGYLGGDAKWMGQDTNRRGLFVQLLVALAEQITLAENSAQKN